MITEDSGGGGNVIGVTGAAPGDLLKWTCGDWLLSGITMGVAFDIRAGAPPIDPVVAR